MPIAVVVQPDGVFGWQTVDQSRLQRDRAKWAAVVAQKQVTPRLDNGTNGQKGIQIPIIVVVGKSGAVSQAGIDRQLHSRCVICEASIPLIVHKSDTTALPEC